jgi:putative nucleotidyltransferase with HDIG domain
VCIKWRDELLTYNEAEKILLTYGGEKDELVKHMRRVTEKAEYMAKKLGLDVRIVKSAAILHDVGKICTVHCPKSYHVYIGRDLLKSCDNDVANIILLHHNFQRNPYVSDYGPVSNTILECAEVIALCDKVDTYMSRSQATPELAVESAKNEYQFKHTDLLLDYLKKRGR